MDPSLQPLLARLDRLSDEFREVREGVRRAVIVADHDPEMALTRARKVLEFVVREIFERRVGESPGTRPLENLLQRLVKDGHLPPRVSAYAHSVRELGNVGTHHFGEGVTADDVYQSLSQLRPILKWYFEVERPDALAQKLEPRTPTEPSEAVVSKVRQRRQRAEPREPRPGDLTLIDLDNGVGMKFAWIPSGTFLMGSPESEEGRDDDETQHRVTLTKGFHIGVHQVTRGQFARFVKAAGYKTQAERDGGAYAWTGEKWELDPNKNWAPPALTRQTTIRSCASAGTMPSPSATG